MKKIFRIRTQLIADIIAILKNYSIEALDASDIKTSTPILLQTGLDGNDNYTLDCIRIENGELLFDGSSCWGKRTWNDGSVTIEALCNIADFLQENEEKIAELFQQQNERVSSYDVCIAPMVNVQLTVKDPRNPSQQERETIIQLAIQAILSDTEGLLCQDNLESIKLYEENVEEGPLDIPVIIEQC